MLNSYKCWWDFFLNGALLFNWSEIEIWCTFIRIEIYEIRWEGKKNEDETFKIDWKKIEITKKRNLKI